MSEYLMNCTANTQNLNHWMWWALESSMPAICKMLGKVRIYLCLQFLARFPDRLYWNLDSDSFIDRWYFFILTQERPAASKTHHTVNIMLSTTSQLQITIPVKHSKIWSIQWKELPTSCKLFPIINTQCSLLSQTIRKIGTYC